MISGIANLVISMVGTPKSFEKTGSVQKDLVAAAVIRTLFTFVSGLAVTVFCIVTKHVSCPELPLICYFTLLLVYLE